jgi:hypothetical protein
MPCDTADRRTDFLAFSLDGKLLAATSPSSTRQSAGARVQVSRVPSDITRTISSAVIESKW